MPETCWGGGGIEDTIPSLNSQSEYTNSTLVCKSIGNIFGLVRAVSVSA